jgi:hypothetical protein
MHAETFQLADARRGILDDTPHHFLVAEPRARIERISHMLLKAVAGLHDAGNAALRVVAAAVGRVLLGDQQHTPVRRQMDGAQQAGDAAAGH